MPLHEGDRGMQPADVQGSSTGPGRSATYKVRSYSYFHTSKAFRSPLQAALGYHAAIHPPKSRVSWKQQSQPWLVIMEGGMVGGSPTSWESPEICLPV